MQQNFGKMETNGKKTWKFDAWVSENSCIPSIGKKMRRKKGRLEEEESEMGQEMVVCGPTMKGGKNRNRMQREKEEKKWNINFNEQKLFWSIF